MPTWFWIILAGAVAFILGAAIFTDGQEFSDRRDQIGVRERAVGKFIMIAGACAVVIAILIVAF